MRMLVPSFVSTMAPTRVRLSLGSREWQTAQPQPSCGTPKLVPVPKNVSFTSTGPSLRSGRQLFVVALSHRRRVCTPASNGLHFHEIRGTGHIERHAGRHDHAITF